jgi:glycerol-1-phosphate dehydrogenase [NAD(P)+]
MGQMLIDRLVAGTYPDPDGGAPLKVATQAVAVARSLDGAEAELVRPLGLGACIAVVSDPQTHEVMGARVTRALKSVAKIVGVDLPAHPHADDVTVAQLRAATAKADALVAVGSGTINDLCKYASALDGKPYVVFGTAPSMNGYTSLNAAITVGGLKKSLAAQAPVAAFFDVSVLSAAPKRMIRSGLGDSLCRPTAQADWLLSHLLFDLPYRTMPFVLLEEDEPALFAGAADLLAGDPAAMERLIHTLLLSGFGTAICGNSLPASQGEHLISHYSDMLPGDDRPFSFHGEQIAVTTLTMARLQERMLEGAAPVLAADRSSEAEFVAHFGAGLGPSCWKEFAQKRLTAERADALNARIAANWDSFRARIAAITLPSDALTQVLKRAGAPTTPEDLGWSRGFYREAVRHARKIRNRYTFLDLAGDARALDRLLDAVA